MDNRSSRAATELRFGLGLVGLLVLFCTLWLGLWAMIPALVLRAPAVAITSGSMGPSIQAGDVIVARPYRGERLSRGAVAVFETPAGDGLVAHRVVAELGDGAYQTRGDANPMVDSTPVPADAILGTGRLLVPLAGLPAAWVRSGQWAALAAWLLVTLLAARLARYAWSTRHDPWAARPAPPSPTPRVTPAAPDGGGRRAEPLVATAGRAA